jgi:hypothetical protein
MPPYLNRPTMMWSPSADAIAFQSVSLLDDEHEVHLLRTSDGIGRSVDVGTCNLKSLLDGFRRGVLQQHRSEDLHALLLGGWNGRA